MSYFNEIYGDPELSSKAKMVLLYCTSVWLNPTASRPQNSIRSLYL